MSSFPRRGLYAVTPDQDGATGERLQAAVIAALRGGAVAIQYRNKTRGHDRGTDASALAAICRRHQAPLIINDDIELAADIGADGAHVGRDDAGPAAARAILGADAIIGVSCYASPDLAVEAAAAGADYVAFGSFFPSTTKPGATPCPVAVLHEARKLVTLPLVAIGGITAENGAALIRNGADVLAVVQDVFGHGDVQSAAARLASLFD